MTRNVTLAVPDELAAEMDQFPQIKWSEVARRAFKQELARLQLYDRLFADSKLTEEDAIELGREINRRVSRRVGEDIEARRASRPRVAKSSKSSRANP